MRHPHVTTDLARTHFRFHPSDPHAVPSSSLLGHLFSFAKLRLRLPILEMGEKQSLPAKSPLESVTDQTSSIAICRSYTFSGLFGNRYCFLSLAIWNICLLARF